MSLAPGAWSTAVDRQWRSYIRDWTAPLIALAGPLAGTGQSEVRERPG